LERRRAAFQVIFDQFAIRYRNCRHISDAEARAERERELVTEVARLRARLLPESIPTLIGAMP
jgi:hypothetical protein